MGSLGYKTFNKINHFHFLSSVIPDISNRESILFVIPRLVETELEEEYFSRLICATQQTGDPSLTQAAMENVGDFH